MRLVEKEKKGKPGKKLMKENVMRGPSKIWNREPTDLKHEGNREKRMV